MTQIAHLAVLAQAQAFQPPAPEAITLRYDAARDADGDPVVYAVLSAEDLRKVPSDLLSGLGVGADKRDVQGDPVFFVGNDAGLSLYVDTDVFPNFKADLIDIAADLGMPLRDAEGDLKMLCAGGLDMAIPDMPAFVHAGMERIDTAVAIATLELERDQSHRLARKMREDDQGSEPS